MIFKNNDIEHYNIEKYNIFSLGLICLKMKYLLKHNFNK